MKRRAFLREAVVWTGLLWIPRAFGQQSALAPRVRQFRRGPSAGCSLFAQSTADNDYIDTTTNNAQRIKAASGCTVCEVRLKVAWTSGTDARFKVQLWENGDRSGTQYGGDSAEVNITSAGYSSAAWAPFTWATKPAPTTHFWVCLVKVGTNDIRWRLDLGHTNGAGYYPYTDATEDGQFCAYYYGSNRSTSDFCIEVDTQ